MKNFHLYTIALTVIMIISGFAYYFLAPQNWGAGELVLDFHLWVGVTFTIYLLFAIPKHIKKSAKKVSSTTFTKLSYLVLLFFGVVLVSGLAHFIPYVSYFFKPVYYQFETYDLISTIHLFSAVILTLLFMLHLSTNHKESK